MACQHQILHTPDKKNLHPPFESPQPGPRSFQTGYTLQAMCHAQLCTMYNFPRRSFWDDWTQLPLLESQIYHQIANECYKIPPFCVILKSTLTQNSQFTGPSTLESRGNGNPLIRRAQKNCIWNIKHQLMLKNDYNHLRLRKSRCSTFPTLQLIQW